MTESRTPPSSVPDRLVLASVATAIAGLLVHNLAEFPVAILLAPETLFPVAITMAFGWALLRRPSRAVFALAGTWALVVIVFGGGSVLPLGIWPFEPEQSVGHYLAHVVYAVSQLPLLWVACRGLRTA